MYRFSKWIKRLLVGIIFSVSSISWAAPHSTPWQFELTPYLWAINMQGTTSIGNETIKVDQSFSDILKHLNFAAMLYATAHKDKFGIYFNGIYAVTSASGTIEMIDANLKNKYGIFGAGISYIIFERNLMSQSKLQLEPFLGARYTLNNTTLKLDDLSFKKDVDWTDPVIGFNVRYDFNPRWLMMLSADVGGTNTTTHYSYSATGLIGYKPVSPSLKNISTYLGYRMLDQHYNYGSGMNFYEWNMRLFGPLLGVTFTF